jgi:phosphatidate phosphatase APP1
VRAANELRQIYQEQITQKLQASDTDGGMPGDFPDNMDIVRNGDEELILFPTYARRHTNRNRSNHSASRPPGTRDSVESPHSTGDADYWRREWEKYEDANAVVDVDVRGWIYTPQRGPLNRKNRLLLAVARRLSGVYATAPSPTASRQSSQAPADRTRLEDTASSHEDEIAAREAENIAHHGQMEAEAAVKGSYSQINHDRGSRTGSPARSHTISEGEDYDPRRQQSLTKRQSWNEPANMSREELNAANEMLLARLRPFMSTPTSHTPITVFFFDDERSVSKPVTTDDSGHFNLRAALDFVPTQIRVLASDKLSATADVLIIEGRGVSLISDIDDTIKHSGIASGAREIFKNTFIRQLGDLTIQGVKEWYTKMASMGVKLHYVSNSPWQLYPLLRSYFALAGLPSGSFHLKQYSGMLQGIFEPAAERKRGSLDRIMNDFPDRKFILVGDSGEADLEVYTDVVLEHPRRVLGVFIRDVTTPVQKGFFDHAVSHALPDSRVSSKDGSRLGRPPRPRDDVDARDARESRPALPARPKTEHLEKAAEDLIDLSDEPDPNSGDVRQLSPPNGNHVGGKGQAPAKPNKPSSLRNFSSTTSSMASMSAPTPGRLSTSDTESQRLQKKQPPPLPRPRRGGAGASASAASTAPDRSESSVAPLSRAPFSSARQNQESDPTRQATTTSSSTPPRSSVSRTDTSTSVSSSSYDEAGYVASARRQIASAYNALPAIRSSSPPRGSADQTGISSENRPNPRRGLSSYPAAAARWATGATGGDPAAGGDAGAPGAPYDKKLEIWRRRWSRAEEVLQQRGVVLRSWRVGGDVVDECVDLVRRETERVERERHGRGG